MDACSDCFVSIQITKRLGKCLLISFSGTKPTAAPGTDEVQQAMAMKQSLLNQLEVLADNLPPNTLDELIDQLGGPEHVAEVS